MSNNTEWRDFFARLTYKPGFEFDYDYLIDYNEHRIMITMQVVDSRDPAALMPQDQIRLEGRRLKLIPVTLNRILPPWHNEDYAKHYVRRLVQDLEMHELDEWLRLDGDLMNDPHADEEAYLRAG